MCSQVGREALQYQVLRAIGEQLDTEAVARDVVRAIAQSTGWPHIAIWSPDDSRRRLVVRAASGGLAALVGSAISVDQGPVGRAFRTVQAQLVPDVRAGPDCVAGRQGVRSELAVPLPRCGRVLGVLDLVSDRPDAFNAEDVRLAEALAEAAALALDHARLYVEMRRHAANMGALYALTRATSRSLALEDVLSQALSLALMSFSFDAGLISLVDPYDRSIDDRPPRLRLMAHRRLPLVYLDRLQNDGLENTLCHYVHTRCQSLVIDDFEQQEAPEDVREQVAEMIGLGWRSYVGIPLMHQGRSLGAFSLFSRQAHTFSAYDLVLLTDIGQQVATAVANAWLFQSTLYERSRLQAVIKSSRDGVVLVGMDGRVLVANAAALRLLRMPGVPEEWLGRRVMDVLRVIHIYAPAIVRTVLAEMRRMQQGDDSPGGGELEVSSCTFRWLNLPVMAGAVPLGRLLILRDVTNERAVERMRQDMTHTMVHDLRNPLASISTALEFLEADAGPVLSADQRQVIEIAYQSTHKMLGLVESILDVSRLESGRMPIKYVQFALSDLTRDVLRAQSSLVADKGLRVESDVPSTLPLAWADAGLIGRVLQNLIGNAIKFTPPGGLIRVAARLEEDKGRPVLLVSVSDNGPGIPAEIRSRLFQKFVTGPQKGRGSGLGLAFCRLAIEAHSERIWVESTPGQGTTFTFSVAASVSSSDPP